MTGLKLGYKRTKYLVNPSFQIRFMVYISIALSVGLLILFFSNLYYFDLLADQGREIGLDANHPYFEFIQDQRDLLVIAYLIASGSVLLLLLAFGLFLSHRIAGPIYRVEKYLEEVAEGKVHLRPVELRNNDFFPEIAGIVNSTIEHYEREHGVVLPYLKEEADPNRTLF